MGGKRTLLPRYEWAYFRAARRPLERPLYSAVAAINRVVTEINPGSLSMCSPCFNVLIEK